jgi:carboxylate-amine ligase
MEHRFAGPCFTLGIEEELMILDADTLELSNSIEVLLDSIPQERLDGVGEVKPELMESVLEISTLPCRDVVEAGAQLSALRNVVRETAEELGLAIGSAGTHPFSVWEEQRIVARPRYRDLVSALRFVARQEVLFGVHVHVGLDDPEKAIYVANGLRAYVPVLLALSANSPFWRSDATGLASTRTPIFRTFPRVGIPPVYGNWDDYVRRIGFMVDSRVVEDYTYLWYDVRPHPNFGTVEVRAMDAQTRISHTLALAALVQALVKQLAERFEGGEQPPRFPFEMLDENKWLAARHGLGGELVDLPLHERVPTRQLVRRLIDELRPHADQLGSTGAFASLDDLLEHGNGAERQNVVYEANRDLRELMREIVAVTAPDV